VTTIQNGVPFSVYDGNAGAAFFRGGGPGDTYATSVICLGVTPLRNGEDLR
jgi:hypothetical protein